jgi:mutator protein MutT
MRRVDAAIAVVVRGGRILICQRKSQDTFGGYWEFPGGKCEAGETLEQCLQRELREEVDITARILNRLSVISHNYPHVQLTLHPFLCEHLAGDPKLIECQAALWIDPGELPKYQFPPANESLLREVAQRLSQLSRAPAPGDAP